jgi:hypothetical protein
VREPETFTIAATAGQPAKLVARIAPTRKDALVLTVNGAKVRAPISRRSGFHEVSFDLPHGLVQSESSVRVETAQHTHYHSFHYFVLQPAPPR